MKNLGKLSSRQLSKSVKQFGKVIIISNLLSLMLSGPAMAEELSKTLIVTGSGVENIAATVAEVQLGVEIQDRTAAEVQQEIATRTTAIVELLRSRNVEKLQTTGVRLNPNYDRLDRDNDQNIITGYTGTNIVSFNLPVEQVGNLLDEAVKAGASRVDSIGFTATPEAIARAKKAALRKASADAQDQAEAVLETLQLTKNEIVKIKIDAANAARPQPYASEFDAAFSESRATTPIIAGEQTVRASVTLQISYTNDSSSNSQ